MKKRISIFSVYSKDGQIDKSVDYYIYNLKLVSTILVIVINGKITDDGLSRLMKLSSNIYIRKNEGFDAGAYKDCIFNYIGEEKLKEFDELVLANDTCFGPFKTFKEIFYEMESVDCDFWGMKKVKCNIFEHIQSWFLVFREKVIKNNEFYNYWRNNINEKNKEINTIYYSFEIKIYRFLTNAGYIASTYEKVTSNINNYYSSYFDLINGGLFLKKKILDDRYYTEENFYMTIKYVIDNYKYPLEIIKEVALNKYGKKINENKINNNYINAKCIYYPISVWSEKSISKQLRLYKNIYVYGAGITAYRIYGFLIDIGKTIAGFIVTNVENNPKTIYGIPVFEKNKEDIGSEDCVIVALNEKNARDIYDEYKTKKNYIWLYDMK